MQSQNTSVWTAFFLGVTDCLLVWALTNDYRHKRALHQRLNYHGTRISTINVRLEQMDVRLAELRKWRKQLEAKTDVQATKEIVSSAKEIAYDRPQVRTAG